MTDDDFSELEDFDDLARWQRMLDDPKPTDYFIHLALTSDDPARYVEAIQTLQVRGTPDVLNAARELCGSVLPHERKLGAVILSQLGDTAPILRVARRLRMMGDEELRAYADKLYARFGAGSEALRAYPKEALSILLPMLESEEDVDTLREVLCAVAEYQEFHPSITPRIAAHRTHPDPRVRFTVSTRLGMDLQNPVAQQALAELANDDDESVAQIAKTWLRLY